MRMQKRKFRIGELATKLNIERFVIRFWEKEFGIKTTRSTGRQRFYDENDYSKFQLIKNLLYEQGFTIAGAKKQLKVKTGGKRPATIIASQKTTFEGYDSKTGKSSDQNKIEALNQQIIDLKNKLRKLRGML